MLELRRNEICFVSSDQTVSNLLNTDLEIIGKLIKEVMMEKEMHIIFLDIYRAQREIKVPSSYVYHPQINQVGS